jgi:clan AA aspartic protease
VGTFTVKFIVKHPARPDQQLELEGLVDTGALFSQVPADVMVRIGVTPSGTRAVHYADGKKDTVPVAKVDIAIDGAETATMVLCGKPNSLILIGASTLETLGFGVDTVHKRLIPIDAPMASSAKKLPAAR